MTDTEIVRGRVVHTERAAYSRNGNPTYRVRLDTGLVLLTKADAQIGYTITNAEYREHTHDFLINKQGRVVSATRTKETR